MRRVSIYRLLPSAIVVRVLRVLGDRAAALWNVAQYLCRDRYLHRAGVPSYGTLCTLLGTHPTYRSLPSDVAQEVLKKVGESWRSYFELLHKHKTGELTDRPSLPGYWKDRRTGHRLFRCIPIKTIRSYSLDIHTFAMTLPSDLRAGHGDRLEIPLRGIARYQGKPGRAEVLYDAARSFWYLHVNMTVPKPVRRTRPVRHAAADRGARIGLAVAINGVDHVPLFRMREAWKDYRYWSRQITTLQGQLAPRGQRTSRRLRRLYQKRQARLLIAYRAMARAVVRLLERHDVTDFAVGDLSRIREAMDFGPLNELVHNFWSFRQLFDALKDACDRVGIRVLRVDERGTSSHCALCADSTPWSSAPSGRGYIVRTVISFMPMSRVLAISCGAPPTTPRSGDGPEAGPGGPPVGGTDTDGSPPNPRGSRCSMSRDLLGEELPGFSRGGESTIPRSRPRTGEADLIIRG